MKSSRTEFRLSDDQVQVFVDGQLSTALPTERNEMWFDTFQYGDSRYYITPRGSVVRMVAVRQCKYQYALNGVEGTVYCPHFLEDPLGTYCVEHEAMLRERVSRREAEEAAKEAGISAAPRDPAIENLMSKVDKSMLMKLLADLEKK